MLAMEISRLIDYGTHNKWCGLYRPLSLHNSHQARRNRTTFVCQWHDRIATKTYAIKICVHESETEFRIEYCFVFLRPYSIH